MKPENMPYYRGQRITSSVDIPTSTPATPPPDDSNADHSHCQSIFTAIIDNKCNGLCHLTNVPVLFGAFNNFTPASAHAALNHDIPAIAQRVLQFSWAVYSFGGGHFLSTIASRGIPFSVALACDTYECGRALFKEFSHCPHIFSTGNDLLHHIRSSGDSSQIHGYLIHSLRFKDSNTASTFWKVQTTIIAQLRCLRNLQVLVAIIIPDHDRRCVKSFIRQLKTSG
jgi:hypothetical protein